MKVGIMSMQRVVNYGSFLQAYGLKKTIENMGHQVEFVDYKREPSLIKEKRDRKQKRIIKKIKNICKMVFPTYRKWRQDQIQSNKTFLDFIEKYNNEFLPCLGITAKQNILPDVDALVIGSDEVFNCTQAGDMVGYSKQLFGKDTHANKLVSYAASFGSTTLEKLNNYHITSEIKDMLIKFDAISVRDRNSFDIVRNLCGMDSEYHIDPVLLYDFPEVDTINIRMKDYIVAYAYSGRFNESEIKKIKEFARKKDKKIISLGFWQTFCDDYILASPLEVLAYIKHADYVITDTFHGTIFSIKYQKKFGTIIRESNKEKLSDLLNKFELSNHQINCLEQMECILDQEVDLKKLHYNLKIEKERAKQYLSRVL